MSLSGGRTKQDVPGRSNTEPEGTELGRKEDRKGRRKVVREGERKEGQKEGRGGEVGKDQGRE